MGHFMGFWEVLREICEVSGQILGHSQLAHGYMGIMLRAVAHGMGYDPRAWPKGWAIGPKAWPKGWISGQSLGN